MRLTDASLRPITRARATLLKPSNPAARIAAFVRTAAASGAARLTGIEIAMGSLHERIMPSVEIYCWQYFHRLPCAGRARRAPHHREPVACRQSPALRDVGSARNEHVLLRH